MKDLNDISRQIQSLIDIEKAHNAQNKLMLWYIIGKGDSNNLKAKKKFFKSLPQATGDLRKLQIANIILLKKLDEICRANNINYWMRSGTLLGAVRHGGFVPWDDDADLGMLRCDAERLIKIVEDNDEVFVSKKIFQEPNNLNRCFQFRFREQPSPYCVDIFIFDYCTDVSSEKMARQAELNKQMAAEAETIARSDISKEDKERKFQETLDKYLEISRKEVGTTDKPSEYIIWALDNTRIKIPGQGNGSVQRVLNPVTLKFEGLSLFAPQDPEGYIGGKYGDIYALPDDMFTHRHFSLDKNAMDVLDKIIEKYSDKGLF